MLLLLQLYVIFVLSSSSSVGMVYKHSVASTPVNILVCLFLSYVVCVAYMMCGVRA